MFTETDMLKLIHHFFHTRGLHPDSAHIEQLKGDGSNRLFWRIPCIETNDSFIVLSNPSDDPFNRRENIASVQIGKHLKSKGVPVPEIFAYDMDKGWIIMEDLGKTRLQEVISNGQNPVSIYPEVVTIMVHMQLKGAEGFDTRWCCQTGYYDSTFMRIYESGYFRDAFLCEYLGLKKDWPELEPVFTYMADRLSLSHNHFFLYHDFQSRNIIVRDGQIGFVDWQGGCLGPPGYDLASLLIDPYVQLSHDIQEAVFQVYRGLLQKHDPILANELMRDYPFLALQRNLQILGAFAFLTRIRKKTCFEQYIPHAVQSLNQRLEDLADKKLAPLKNLVREISKEFSRAHPHVIA